LSRDGLMPWWMRLPAYPPYESACPSSPLGELLPVHPPSVECRVDKPKRIHQCGGGHDSRDGEGIASKKGRHRGLPLRVGRGTNPNIRVRTREPRLGTAGTTQQSCAPEHPLPHALQPHLTCALHVPGITVPTGALYRRSLPAPRVLPATVYAHSSGGLPCAYG
jgi:hypothetical protein